MHIYIYIYIYICTYIYIYAINDQKELTIDHKSTKGETKRSRYRSAGVKGGKTVRKAEPLIKEFED